MQLDKIIDTADISTGKQIKLQRILENKRQADLSEQLGISQPTLSRYEAGKQIDVAHLEAVNRYLNGNK